MFFKREVEEEHEERNGEDKQPHKHDGEDVGLAPFVATVFREKHTVNHLVKPHFQQHEDHNHAAGEGHDEMGVANGVDERPMFLGEVVVIKDAKGEPGLKEQESGTAQCGVGVFSVALEQQSGGTEEGLEMKAEIMPRRRNAPRDKEEAEEQHSRKVVVVAETVRERRTGLSFGLRQRHFLKGEEGGVDVAERLEANNGRHLIAGTQLQEMTGLRGRLLRGVARCREPLVEGQRVRRGLDCWCLCVCGIGHDK